MALMGQPAGIAGNTRAEASVGADKGEAFKASKKEAAKKFAERKAARAKQAYENALKLRDELVKGGYLDKLSAPIKDFVLTLCKDPAEKKVANGFGGPSIFTVLFGETPNVGDVITLEQAFHKTYKGMSTLDMWVKRWADKGIVVEKVLDSVKVLNTTYTIKALPAA